MMQREGASSAVLLRRVTSKEMQGGCFCTVYVCVVETVERKYRVLIVYLHSLSELEKGFLMSSRTVVGGYEAPPKDKLLL